ncbi:hypothetical protein [uncultured Maribacter sp.]|uniref:hypothetical protein n=1 Tax=uncultured Maribacter sp. TaxID=431308 RepID=UPI0030D9E385
MKITDKTMNELYKSLGKLFYAVAICDGSVHLKEWDKVEEIVKENWLYVDDFTDRYGTDAANQIEIVFDWLLEYEKTSEECFKEFKEFYEEHPQVFSQEIKSLIKKTTNAIANSFSRKNKSELMLLAKIDLLLK